LGGGRYDGLSEALGGPAAPGIGFAIGEDRLVMSLKETAEGVLRKPDVYIAPMAGMNAEAARLARELRRHDLVVDLGDDTFRLKKSFEAATKVGAKYILILGENEVKADAFAVKNLATGEQVQVARAELAVRIRAYVWASFEPHSMMHSGHCFKPKPDSQWSKILKASGKEKENEEELRGLRDSALCQFGCGRRGTGEGARQGADAAGADAVGV